MLESIRTGLVLEIWSSSLGEVADRRWLIRGAGARKPTIIDDQWLASIQALQPRSDSRVRPPGVGWNGPGAPRLLSNYYRER